MYRPTPLKPSDMGADGAAATSAAMAQMACERLCTIAFSLPPNEKCSMWQSQS